MKKKICAIHITRTYGEKLQNNKYMTRCGVYDPQLFIFNYTV